MPSYSYKCRKCDHRFQEILPVLETFFAKTSRKA